jgi:hypothetical protein
MSAATAGSYQMDTEAIVASLVDDFQVKFYSNICVTFNIRF